MFSIKAHFLIWSYQACNYNDKLLTCMATQVRHGWFGPCLVKKQLVKKIWGRILDIAWLKFAVAALLLF